MMKKSGFKRSITHTAVKIIVSFSTLVNLSASARYTKWIANLVPWVLSRIMQ